MIVKKNHTLFIGSLPSSCTVRVLKEYFKKTLNGKFKLKKGKNKGKNKAGYAIITVFSDVDKAILLYNEHLLKGNKLKFQKYKTQDELFLEASDMLQRRIYINNLPIGTTQLEVEKLFSQFGEIETVFLKEKVRKIENHNLEEKVLKSFITFKNGNYVNKCLEKRPIYINGQELELYQKTTPKSRDTKKFVIVPESYSNQGAPRKDRKDPYDSPEGNLNKHFRKKKLEKNFSNFTQKTLFSTDFTSSFSVPGRVTRRGKRGRFGSSPFKCVPFEYVDWMNYPVEEFFSLKGLVPRRLEAVIDGREGEDFVDGYNHHPANLRMNKEC